MLYSVTKDKEILYVGQTVMSLAQRKGAHLSIARRGQGSVLARAIRKYGEKSFDFKVLAKAENQNQLDLMEKMAIKAIKPRYNTQDGGKFNFAPWNKGKKETRAEVLERIAKAAVNRKRTKRGNYSKEHCAKISAATKLRCQKPFVCLQTGEIFFNKIDAARKLDLNHNSLLVLLCGKTRLKTLKGYSFTYI